MTKKRNNPETIAIHGGDYRSDPATNAVAVPIYRTTSYQFQSVEHAANLFALKDKHPAAPTVPVWIPFNLSVLKNEPKLSLESSTNFIFLDFNNFISGSIFTAFPQIWTTIIAFIILP